MPTKAEFVEQLKELGVEADVNEKTSDLQKKLDDALAAKNGGQGAPGGTPPADGTTTPPPPPPETPKPAKTRPFLKCGVYHKRVQYQADTECPKELVETFRELGAIEDRLV